MKKIIYIITIAFLSFSCSDFLEENNLGNETADKVYSDANNFEGLVAAGYSSLRTLYGRLPWLWCSGTDMYMISRRDNEREIQNYVGLDPTNGQVWEFYRDAYRGIQVVNTGLYYADKGPEDFDDTALKTRIAELRFIRAYYHFLLVEQFGGIAINDRVTDEPRTDLVRASLEDSYKFIIEEMEDIINDLPAKASQRGRVDQSVVKHFLAKAYLTKGWDLGDKADFNKAITYAEEVIGSQSISIPFDKLWHYTNENNDEVIWAIQYDVESLSNPESGGNIQQACFGPYLDGQSDLNKYTATQFPVTWHVHDRFDADDARYEGTFMITVPNPYFDYWLKDPATLPVRLFFPRVPGGAWTNDQTNAWKAEAPELRNDAIIHPFPPSANDWKDVVRNHAPVKKFDDPINLRWNVNASTRDVVVARLAETFFLAAEAYIAIDEPGKAAAKINSVRKRPGNSVSGGSLPDIQASEMNLDKLLIESSKEFVGEYLRWPELRRTGKLIDFCILYNPDISDEGNFMGLDGKLKKYRPIPSEAYSLNKMLTQNEGYIPFGGDEEDVQ